MAQNKPTSRIDELGNLDLRPEDAVGDFFESKLQEEIVMKPPTWDSPGETLEILSIQSEREYLAMKYLQSKLLQDAKFQKCLNEKRVKEMSRRQKKLRERFIEVNAFIRNCEEKEQAAERKMIEEEKMQQQLKLDIDSYKKDIEELEAFNNILMDAVEALEPYEKTIEEVVQKSDNLSSIKDCKDTCDALTLAQAEISKIEKEKIAEIEGIRREMVKITNNTALQIIGLKNDFDEIVSEYSKAHKECLKWEKILSIVKEYVLESELTENRILDALYQMYTILCKRRGMELTVHRNDIEGQLDFIKDEIEVLQRLVEYCQENEK